VGGQPAPSIPGLIREGVLDAELAALLWLVGEGGVPIHVAATEPHYARSLADALAAVARDPAAVSHGPGAALEDVLRQPVPLRPASGVVLILGDRRVGAAHIHRPPLRDAGGHIRPQGPAVLAVWDERAGAWEHFAWGVTPELADAVGRRAGDFEIEHGRRREYLEALEAAEMWDPDQVRAALAGYGVGGAAQ
jgi:hypothetical protein